MKSEIRS